MRSTLKNLVLPLLATFLFGFSIYHMVGAQRVETTSAPPAFPPRSPYGESIAGAGLVEPASENIHIGSSLAGVVAEVWIPADKTGSVVAAGDPLFRIDTRQLEAQLAVQLAALRAPQAQLAKLAAMPRPEEVEPARHRVEVARAGLNQAADEFRRATKLMQNNAIAEIELVRAREGHERAIADLARAEAELKLLQAGAWEPDVMIARASLAQIEAEMQEIETEIERSTVRSPVNGKVLQVNVQPGEYVAAPPNEPLIVLGDVSQPRVRVDIDEADIPRFSPQAAARAKIRGAQGGELPLKFVRVEPYVIPKKSLTGASDERVDTRVLQVIYTIEAPQDAVYVGQQLDVFIDAAPVPQTPPAAQPSPSPQDGAPCEGC